MIQAFVFPLLSFLMNWVINDPTVMLQNPKQFYFGADLSYVNQIMDHGGVYKDKGEIRNPYRIFKDHGADIVRFRLWHNPQWTKELYGLEGKQLYNDLEDVERGIRLSKEQGMEVLLDFHFADNWVDPGKQEIPKAWQRIKSIGVLEDSVYQYTYNTLIYLESKGLMPEFIQIGNETNCGMLYTGAAEGFPGCNVCKGEWINFGRIINRAIGAIKKVSESSKIKSRIILHVADPKNIEWWFDNVAAKGDVHDFDIIGFSYYPIWHTDIALKDLSSRVKAFRLKYQKELMILETAYPWTSEGKDSYSNTFGSQSPLSNYPFTIQGQYDILHTMTQSLMEGGGIGIIYWEPAWVSADIKDQWGKGSSWENNAFFDFAGNTISGINFMNDSYK